MCLIPAYRLASDTPKACPTIQDASMQLLSEARMYYSAKDKLARYPERNTGEYFRRFSLTPRIHTGHLQDKAPVKLSTPALAQASCPAPPGFSLRFAKSCMPVFIGPSRKARKYEGITSPAKPRKV